MINPKAPYWLGSRVDTFVQNLSWLLNNELLSSLHDPNRTINQPYINLQTRLILRLTYLKIDFFKKCIYMFKYSIFLMSDSHLAKKLFYLFQRKPFKNDEIMLFISSWKFFSFSRYLCFSLDFLVMQKNGLIRKIRSKYMTSQPG